jgi:hypothetical protein
MKGASGRQFVRLKVALAVCCHCWSGLVLLELEPGQPLALFDQRVLQLWIASLRVRFAVAEMVKILTSDARLSIIARRQPGLRPMRLV